MRCPKCRRQREVELAETLLPREDGKIKVEKYKCPKGHEFERVVGRWRSTVPGKRPRIPKKKEIDAGVAQPGNGDAIGGMGQTRPCGGSNPPSRAVRS